MLKDKILEALKDSNGMRLRELFPQVNATRLETLDALFALQREGLVEPITIRDIANMELYNLWKITSTN